MIEVRIWGNLEEIVYVKKILIIILFFPFFTLFSSFEKVPVGEIHRWMVYYGQDERPKTFSQFDLVVLDSEYPYPFRYLLDNKTQTLAYISLGELSKERSYYLKLEAKGLFLEENPYWQGSFFVDLRKSAWTEFLLEDLIPVILQKGYQGLFMDTLDNADYLEAKDPQKFAGMRKAAAKLVKRIRKEYPQVLLMLNRAYYLYDDLANDLDLVLAESMYSDYDFEAQVYIKRPDADYQRQLRFLLDLKKKNSKVKLCSLDYWDPTDQEEFQRIRGLQRAEGLLPYVSDLSLNRIYFESS